MQSPILKPVDLHGCEYHASHRPYRLGILVALHPRNVHNVNGRVHNPGRLGMPKLKQTPEGEAQCITRDLRIGADQSVSSRKMSGSSPR